MTKNSGAITGVAASLLDGSGQLGLNNGSYFNTINANDYFNKTDILGFGYYNSTDFDINDYQG